jgi:hypothetical protein
MDSNPPMSNCQKQLAILREADDLDCDHIKTGTEVSEAGKLDYGTADTETEVSEADEPDYDSA